MPLNMLSKPIGPVDEGFVEKARKFAKERIEPNADRAEMNHEQPSDIMRDQIKEFTTLVVPKELGGSGSSYITRVLVLEELAKADIGITFACTVHGNCVWGAAKIPNIPLRDRYLPGLLSGKTILSFVFTEPQSGSDAAGMKCRAEEKGGKWVINGEKAWVTSSSTADLLFVFAQTKEVGNTKGVIAFLVDAKTKGIERTKPYDMIGAHAMNAGGLTFSNCTVDAEQVAFPVGFGFRAALMAIDIARLGVGSMCNGVLQGCLETAIEYAKERMAFGAPIIKNQGVMFKFTDAVTNLEASRSLNYQAAFAMDNGDAAASLLCSHSKKYASRVAWIGVHDCMDNMGSNGLTRTYRLARQLSGLAMCSNTDGTNEICNIVIGRSF